MIKIYLSELKNLKKDIFLYLLVLSILYSIIIAMVSFSKIALDDINTTINNSTRGIDFEVKISNPDNDIKKYIENNYGHDISYFYLQESNVTSSPVINNSLKEEHLEGVILCEASKDNSVNYDIDEKELPDDCIILSDKTAKKLKLTTGDSAYFTIEQGTQKTECLVGGIFRASEARADFMLTPRCEQRILHENSLSELYFVIHQLDRHGYNSSSGLYNFIHEQIDSVYTMSKGLIAMSVVLEIALTAIFLSFFTVIIVRRNSFISLLIHHGMLLKRIVFLYWLILETMHLFITAISVPAAYKLCKWLNSEYSRTFDMELLSGDIDITSVMIVFVAIFAVIAISMLLFSRKLKRLNHRITGMKGSVV